MLLYGIDHDNYLWDPWFGCFKISEACQNCYINNLNSFLDIFYYPDERKLKKEQVVVVGTHTDFFLEEADHLRHFAWNVIRNNPNIIFEIYTKRVDRIMSCIPEDWGEGWENVVFCVTAENQKRADERIPILVDEVKCKHKWINCAPLLEEINISDYLSTGKIESVTTSGERRINGNVRPTKFEWFKSLSQQCKQYNVHFEIMFLGNMFIQDNRTIEDNSKCFKSALAHRLKLNNYVPISFNI
jgi:protein gp37